MVFDVTSFVVGLLMGTLVTAAIAFPRVGRILARAVATIALAAGAGGLVWSINAIAWGQQLTSLRWGPLIISEPDEVLGWASGLLLAGVTALALSFIGRSSSGGANPPRH